MDLDAALRAHLRALLTGGQAHLTFDQAVDELPDDLRGVRGPSDPHTPWQLVEHLRIAQWDILEFSRDPAHISPEFPEGYWPPTEAPPDPGAWDRTLGAFRADLKAMIDLIENPSTDLIAPIAGGDGQTILREALLIADHNAYHLGQLILVRKRIGAWEKE